MIMLTTEEKQRIDYLIALVEILVKRGVLLAGRDGNGYIMPFQLNKDGFVQVSLTNKPIAYDSLMDIFKFSLTHIGSVKLTQRDFIQDLARLETIENREENILSAIHYLETLESMHGHKYDHNQSVYSYDEVTDIAADSELNYTLTKDDTSGGYLLDLDIYTDQQLRIQLFSRCTLNDKGTLLPNACTYTDSNCNNPSLNYMVYKNPDISKLGSEIFNTVIPAGKNRHILINQFIWYNTVLKVTNISGNSDSLYHMDIYTAALARWG